MDFDDVMRAMTQCDGMTLQWQKEICDRHMVTHDPHAGYMGTQMLTHTHGHRYPYSYSCLSLDLTWSVPSYDDPYGLTPWLATCSTVEDVNFTITKVVMQIQHEYQHWQTARGGCSTIGLDQPQDWPQETTHFKEAPSLLNWLTNVKPANQPSFTLQPPQ